ncbi:MAG: YqaA family protein [Moraxellaceae bacterium]|nr:YqaA family protein [Moraxellaceae bacterium]MDP1776248.1 YqaA family protein [Moraxellaceae bacterium]
MSAYLGLFAVAFVAATLLPMGSEAVLAGLVMSDRYLLWTLVLVATVGNVLGSVVNWWMGGYVSRFKDRAWFPANAAQLAKAERHYQRYGRWSLLLSWMPVIGDPLTVIAGVLREPLWRFTLVVTVAKLGRYLVVVALALQI